MINSDYRYSSGCNISPVTPYKLQVDQSHRRAINKMMLKFAVVFAVIASALGFKLQMKTGEVDFCS